MNKNQILFRNLLPLSLLLCSSTIHAYEFCNGDIYYDINNNEATVTYATTDYNSYSGDVTIPATVENDGVTYPVTAISSNAFYNCSSLSSISIPTSVTSFGEDAFKSCTKLTKVSITDLSAWNEVSFSNYHANPLCCAAQLYVNGSKITTLEFAEGIEKINDYVFNGCSSITSLTIPASVKTIGKDAFRSCTQLKKVIISDLKAWCNIDFSNSNANPLLIGEHLYIKGNNTEVTDLVIPDGVTEIKAYAFRGAGSLTSVSIPSSVSAIGKDAFTYTKGLQMVYTSDLTSWCNIDFSNLYSNPLHFAGHLSVGDEHSEITDLVIPDDVTNIKKYVFSGFTCLKTVSIPNSVTTISDYAFDDCENLVSVNLHEGITTIGNHAFEDCSSLESIELPDAVTSLGEYAFYRCSSLKTAKLSNSLTEIAHNVFYLCTALTDVNIPDAVTTIGLSAFGKCSSLPSITLGKSVETISNAAFQDCTNLATVITSDATKTIGVYAFWNCTNLTTFTVGSAVESIGECAFNGCTNIADIYSYATTPPTLGKNAFSNYNANLYVPESSITAYKKTTWKNFKISSLITSSETFVCYDDSYTLTGKATVIYADGNEVWMKQGNKYFYGTTANGTAADQGFITNYVVSNFELSGVTNPVDENTNYFVGSITSAPASYDESGSDICFDTLDDGEALTAQHLGMGLMIHGIVSASDKSSVTLSGIDNSDVIYSVVNHFGESASAARAHKRAGSWSASQNEWETYDNGEELNVGGMIALDDNDNIVIYPIFISAVSSEATSKIEIDADSQSAPVEYYNLNGVRVNPTTPGVYIRRQGTKTTKVLVK